MPDTIVSFCYLMPERAMNNEEQCEQAFTILYSAYIHIKFSIIICHTVIKDSFVCLFVYLTYMLPTLPKGLWAACNNLNYHALYSN